MTASIPSSGRARLWHLVWVSGLLIGVALFYLYSWLPADGATGDLESFTPEGFRVQWLLESRRGGLRVGDVVVRAGGHTAEEWLTGASRGSEWRTGGLVRYEILREGEPDQMTLEISLAPVRLRSVLARWTPQFAVSLAFLVIGFYVFWKRPEELAARVLMLFCTVMALQYWGDAFNFQYATLPWRWPFWFQLTFEHLMYSVSIATVAYFALIFPTRHPLVQRYPRLTPLGLYLSHGLAILAAMALAPSWSAALSMSNRASWAVTLAQLGLAVAAGVRSIRTARDPVTRAQIRWIVWCGALGMAILVPGYVLALVVTGRPLVPHPATMLVVALIPFTLGIAILRYHLFDIEVVINRTLVYGTLTVLLSGLYLLLVRVLTLVIPRVLDRENNTLVVFLATLIIALSFAPLRRRVQAIIARAFYRHKPDYQDLLPEMSERLAGSLDLEKLALLLTQELPERLQINWSTLSVLDQGCEQYVPLDSGDDHQLLLPAGQPIVSYSRRTGAPLLRLQPPPDLPDLALAFLEGNGIELSIPLIAGKSQVGLYFLGSKRSGDAYTRHEVRLLHLLGKQAAVALENSRLFKAEQEQRKYSEALREAGAVISSTLDPETVLSRIAEQMGRAIDATRTCINSFDPVNRTSATLAEYVREPVAAPMLARDRGEENRRSADAEWLEAMQAGRHFVLHADDVELDETERVRMERAGAKSILYIPLRIKGELIGYAELSEGRVKREFSEDEVALCDAIAQQAAVALEHARLYEQAQREIAERAQAEERLKASLREKEVLLKEIHHRVKNNLQVVSSMLHLQTRNVRDDAALAMFRESRIRVNSMALVHEKLYQAQDLAQVDFADYVRSLANYLHLSQGATASHVTMDVSVQDAALSIDSAVPCGLILNELISNSFKHAFPEGRGGHVSVDFAQDGGEHFVMTVKDNGVGLPIGIDWRNAESLGLQLVTALVEQLEGSIELLQNGGTEFQIRFVESGRGEGDS